MQLYVRGYYYAAVAQTRKASECLTQNKFGEEIARLLVAEGSLKQALAHKNLTETQVNQLKVRPN